MSFRHGIKKINHQYATIIFTILLLAFYWFLQLSWSLPVYRNIPILSYIQFPWRMLTIISPLSLILFAVLVNYFNTIKIVKALNIGLILWIILYIITCPVFGKNGMTYQKIDLVAPSSFYESGEYTPKIFENGNIVKMPEMLNKYISYLKDNPNKLCDVLQTYSKFEDPRREYNVNCKEPSDVVMPLSYSRYTRLWVDGVERDPLKSMTDPRISVRLPKGVSIITTQDPTLATMIARAFSF